MYSVRTDKYLQNCNVELKNRIMLYLEQPVIFENTEYTSGEIMFLSYICKNPGITSIKLANTVKRTRGTVSIAMKKMIDKGLIYFKDAPDHRKRKLIFSTRLGEELNLYCIEKEKAHFQKLNKVLTDKYSSEELKTIFSALSDIILFTIHDSE